MKKGITKWIAGLWMLIRPVPVAAWAIAAPAIGLAGALKDIGFREVKWSLVIPAFLVTITLHGGVSHAVNERADWISGTDRLSSGILSGGSKVIQRGFLTLRDLDRIGQASLIGSLILGIYVALHAGPWLWLHLAIGVWAALAYSLPPLRLSSKPLLGEWLCAWPALIAACSSTYYIATGQLAWRNLLAGGLHGVFSLGWLLEHHLSDIPADLAAQPPKITTVAYTARRWGWKAAPLIPALYFLSAIPLAVLFKYYSPAVSWEVLISAGLAVRAAAVALKTQVTSIPDITRRENQLTVITFLHALWLMIIA